MPYTAFGELVVEWTDDQGQLHCQVGGELPMELSEAGAPPVNRYWYAGAWGYETGGLPSAGAPPGSDPNRSIIALYGPDPDLPPITLLHVGYRWYDPALGRFIQRDPIGLLGGLNVYGYMEADPVVAVDPEGLLGAEERLIDWLSRHPRLARGFLTATGGQRHVPVIDYGPGHTIVVSTAEVVSFIAPAGTCARVITMGPKAVRAAKKGSWIAKRLLRLRQYIRYDRHPPHPGSPHPWDGEIIRWLRGKLWGQVEPHHADGCRRLIEPRGDLAATAA